ncbi:hypothetical protein ACE6H2_018132 [Prunus campanulata]
MSNAIVCCLPATKFSHDQIKHFRLPVPAFQNDLIYLNQRIPYPLTTKFRETIQPLIYISTQHKSLQNNEVQIWLEHYNAFNQALYKIIEHSQIPVVHLNDAKHLRYLYFLFFPEKKRESPTVSPKKTEGSDGSGSSDSIGNELKKDDDASETLSMSPAKAKAKQRQITSSCTHTNPNPNPKHPNKKKKLPFNGYFPPQR